MTTEKTIINNGAKHRMREGMLILSMCVSLYLLLALFTYHHSDPGWSTTGSTDFIANSGGRLGAWVSDFLLYFFGYMAYLFPFLLAGLAWLSFRHHGSDDHITQSRWYGLRSLGFVIFMIAGTGLLSLYLDNVHAGVPLDAGGVLGDVISASFVSLLSTVGATLILIALLLAGLTLMFGVAWFQSFGIIGGKLVAAYQKYREARRLKQEAKPAINVMSEAPVSNVQRAEVPPPVVTQQVKQPKPVKQKPISKAKKKKMMADLSKDTSGDLPSLDLLDDPEDNTGMGYTNAELEELSRLVEMRLSEFGIEVKVEAVYPGPVVTRFELSLAPGMKVSKISTLSKDIARSLSQSSVRVVEVIPGKSFIGLEIPNEKREMVRLKEVLADSSYQNADSLLTLGLGKDIAGHPVSVDIARMPHLLVAGTTGSGKSVSVNAMILSLLFKATPEQVRLIMIDPKMLELSIYEGIPHLLTPVVTDMKEAANALRWCVAEMDRRYRLMASLSVRNLAGFNDKVRAAIKEGDPIPDPFFPADAPGEVPMLEPLPQIVVVVDELADMMMVVGKKVENLIARIAQKARAAGIHMLLATQRPSVDVLTGLIKANIPTRIAFQVSSRVDSRTVLDQQGAEQLLGHGDMLYMPPGVSVPIRVHGAFVADEEVVRVVAAWKKRGEPDYQEEILTAPSENSAEPGMSFGGDEDGNAEQDPLYDQAVQIVLETRRASISSVQRRLKIGYNRAARIIEAMEEAGLVSAMEGNGSREVLAPPPPKD